MIFLLDFANLSQVMKNSVENPASYQYKTFDNFLNFWKKHFMNIALFLLKWTQMLYRTHGHVLRIQIISSILFYIVIEKKILFLFCIICLYLYYYFYFVVNLFFSLVTNFSLKNIRSSMFFVFLKLQKNSRHLKQDKRSDSKSIQWLLVM